MVKTKKSKISEKDVFKDLSALKNALKAAHRFKFFQAHKGGYGEGDLFLGLTVPQQRTICKKYYKDLSLKETEKLLKNKFHEARFTALLILAEKFKDKNVSPEEKEKIARLYLRNAKFINNWDLVDLSAPFIIGAYWFENGARELSAFPGSGDLWKERIAVLATLYFIRRGDFSRTVHLAEYFLRHKHDLMHKASGWMLREAGKRDSGVLYKFLDKHASKMPRTMLRYAVERLPENKRKYYMGQ